MDSSQNVNNTQTQLPSILRNGHRQCHASQVLPVKHILSVNVRIYRRDNANSPPRPEHVVF